MVPVSLRLENFLSYGKAQAPLSFESFQVACLSGGNGQGKSSLLEAMTWALWGEARKPQGSVKPDEHLLRIGSSDMRVEFTFDLEGDRYLILRTYQRSATGKTAKSLLELQLFDPKTERFVTQTGASKRDTQQVINDLLGLDYDTFINACFLLQGRSDEFTKRPATERKQILSNILNLGRYDLLREKARKRLQEAKNKVELGDMQLAQLAESLQEVERWRTERQDIQHHLNALDAERQTAAQTEQTLAAQKAYLQTISGTLDDVTQRIQNNVRREQEIQKVIEKLGLDLSGAELLIAQEIPINSAHERYQALLTQRTDWDQKSDLYRGLEAQVQQLEAEIRQITAQGEIRLARLKSEMEHQQAQIRQAEDQLAREPEVRKQWEDARQAQATYEALKSTQQTIRGLERQLEDAKQALRAYESAHEAQIRQLAQQLTTAEASIAQEAVLAGQLQQAREADALRKIADLTLQQLKEDGLVLRDAERREQDALSTLHQQKQDLEGLKTKVRTATSETCPTCGTRLTEAHRAHMLALYDEQLSELQTQISAQETQVQSAQLATQTKRTDFIQQQKHRQTLDGSEQRLTEAEREWAILTQHQARISQLREDLQHLRETWETDTERHRLEAHVDALHQQRAGFSFDEAEFERVGQKAARFDLLRRDVDLLERTRGQHETLLTQIRHKNTEFKDWQTRLAEGTLTQTQEQRKTLLKTQLAKVGYDAAAHQTIRQELNSLQQAPTQFAHLAHAKLNVVRWQQDLDAREAESAQLTHESEQLALQREELRTQLAEEPELTARHQSSLAMLTQLNEEIEALRTQLGRLEERLTQAAEDERRTRALRENIKTAKAEQQRYKLLVEAFGPDGIPAMIIEETLPELQERANDLLFRLSDGRMSIRLETIKTKKDGGHKSTLDIIINDELGQPRPYETFSGGEAFRVNFALRIALSQLLAERSGVRIRTLVIDEGFGTQDQTGIQLMIEAIQTIRPEFEKIIVITHLEEMKNAFPVRIEVHKEPEGSHYEVLYEG